MLDKYDYPPVTIDDVYKEILEQAENFKKYQGYNPELNQLSKSYCIQLDEDGNVGDHTVTGGGFDDPHDSSVTIISRDNHLIIRKTVHQEPKLTVSNTLTTMSR